MITNKRPKKITIDLRGPAGNAFAILGTAMTLSKQLGKDWEKIKTDMISSDYEHLLEVFEREFGQYVIMYR